jgi:hypothetical protein
MKLRESPTWRRGAAVDPSVARIRTALKEKNGTGVIELLPTSPTGGIIKHSDGDHACVGGFSAVRSGQNVAGHKLALVRSEEGTYETVDGSTGQTGARLCGGNGPAQVATEPYRTHWEQTFGSRGGPHPRVGVHQSAGALGAVVIR